MVGRLGSQLGGGHGHVFGVAGPLVGEPENLVTDLEPGHVRTELGHHTTHTVEIDADSLLSRTLGVTTAEVNSFHHQSVEKLGANLRISARSEDGVIEGIEALDRDYVVGVQWHAESLTNREEHEQLFRGLAEAAIRYRSNSSARSVQAV